MEKLMRTCIASGPALIYESLAEFGIVHCVGDRSKLGQTLLPASGIGKRQICGGKM